MSRGHHFSKAIALLRGTLCLALAACSSTPAPPPKKDSNPWAVIKKPVFLGAKPEVFGFYSYGCLSGAVELAISGPFWEVVNSARNRYYAHPDSVHFLEKLGTWALAHGKLLLGDISQPLGGPTSYGHASHQMGLDIDLRFGFTSGPLTPEVREGYPEVAVAMHAMEAKDGSFQLINKMMPTWRSLYGEAIKMSALQPRVERIFVSPPIKKTICEQFRVANGSSGYTYPSWLSKVRPYYEHNAHFHVRLRCPDDSPACERQKPSPPDPSDSSFVGCSGAEFAWWFEPDSQKPGYLHDSMTEYVKRNGVPAPKASLDWESKHKKLPPACLELLRKGQAGA